MKARHKHSTLTARYLLIAVLACALGGCWEEIHYSPPPAEQAPVASTPIEPEDQATGFADEVANSLAGETASAVGEPAATPITAPPTPSPTPPTATETDRARSTRRMAWSLGSNLSLAALANDRAASADKVATWYETAQQQATLFDTAIADLPPRPAANEVDPQAARAIEFLFDQGQALGQLLAAQYGDDHAALFELALKSNILLVRYQPGAPVVNALSAAVSQAGERAKLPAELYQPLLKLIDEGAPAKSVREAVFQLHADVDHYLSTAQP